MLGQDDFFVVSAQYQYIKNKIKNTHTREPSTILKIKKKLKKYKNKNTPTQKTPKLKTLAAYPSPLTPLPSETISSPATLSDQVLDSKSLLI